MTADTFFRRIKRPQAWLGRIWLFEHGVAVSSSRFHKLAGVTYDTARNIFKKLTAVIASHLEDECVPSALFAPVIGKRSLETPAGAHPRAEAEEMESKWRQTTSAFCPGGDGTGSSSSPAACQSDCKSDSEPELQAEASTVVNSPNPSDKLTEQDKRVYDCLSEKPVQFDSLCVKLDMKAGQLSSTLTMLELAGLAKSLAGNQYVCGKDREAAAASPASRPSRTSKTTSIVAGIIKFVRCHFHAVSWKYLQNYLAAHWCLIDRARWTCGSLLKACLRFGYITSSATLDHVSPLSVKISPCSQA